MQALFLLAVETVHIPLLLITTLVNNITESSHRWIELLYIIPILEYQLLAQLVYVYNLLETEFYRQSQMNGNIMG
jgi:hypothetical protein